jgi:zinc/manganese transport system substrate-binding protein
MVLSRRPVNAALVALALIGVALVACGGDDDTRSDAAVDSGTDSGTDGVRVVATTSIWADVVSNVACDGLAAVTSIVPPGTDPHTYETSLRDREELDDATLVVANGLDLEPTLVDVLDAVAADGVPVVEVTDSVDVVDGDPHVWQDPVRVRDAAVGIGDALVNAGLPADEVAACVDAYTSELDALDDEVSATLSLVPDDRRVFVTNHDSLGYFADRYGFEVLGTVIPAATTLAETNPADLEELASAIDEAGVPVVFAELDQPDAVARSLAERVGEVDIVALYTDSLGEAGSGADTYVGMIRTNSRAIAEALGTS